MAFMENGHCVFKKISHCILKMFNVHLTNVQGVFKKYSNCIWKMFNMYPNMFNMYMKFVNMYLKNAKKRKGQCFTRSQLEFARCMQLQTKSLSDMHCASNSYELKTGSTLLIKDD